MIAHMMRRIGALVLFVFAGVLFVASPAAAQVAFDAASNAAAATTSTANPITVTWNHTVGTAKKPYLVVQVAMDLNGGGQTVTSVTWASESGSQQPMALLGSSTNGTFVRSELWGLANPQPGNHTISVAVANGGGQSTVIMAGARSFSNVLETVATGTAVAAAATSTTPSVTVANTVFGYVVDAVSLNGANALTASAGQTNTFNLTAAASSGAGSTKTGVANATMSWTSAVSHEWAAVAVPLQSATPQIFFDAASSLGSALNSTANPINFSWSHTTTTAANRYIVVAVPMDVNGGTANVNTVTYGTEGGGPNTPLTRIGFQLNGTRTRVELWSVKAPASGTHTITVSITNAGGQAVSYTGGAQTFRGVDQSVPLGTAVGTTGTSTNPAIAVANTAYDYVVDGVAFEDAAGVAPGATQDQRFQNNYTPGAGRALSGASSGLRGYTNSTMQWVEANSARWAIEAVPLKAVSVAVTKSASADVVKLGSQVTYTLTATNYSAASVAGITITDAIPSGASFVSQTGCAGTGPVTCTVGTLAAGATSATFTITVVPTAAGTISNVATVTWTGALGSNSTETIKTLAESKICATPGKDGVGGTLAGIKNDYWPGTTVAAGATSITLGARVAGAAGNTITSGDLLIVMQMQDAAFDTTNDETYGEGTGSTGGTGTGSGAATNLNNAGRWEYVVATNSVSAAGGTLNLAGGGAGGGLLYAYTTQTYAATTTEGQRTFQVIRVPQYTTATLGSTLTALAWNGSTGGVLAIDVSGTLTLGSATVSVDGLGYRAGGGRLLTAAAGLVFTDFRTSAALNANGSKGEGISGTPQYIYGSGATIGAPGANTPTNTGVEGYVGGSNGRGAPGNAGGGSTDGNPAANDQNSGGGGGGNGGSGGSGGNSWNSNHPSGGQGGGGISPSLTRITMGGGGGAGTSNNGTAETCTAPPTCRVNTPGDWTDTDPSNGYYSSGADGGGIIIMRAMTATGTGTLTSNGLTAANTGRDGSGGGGAGGSVLFTTQIGTLSGLTIQVKGGNGGNAWLTQDGVTVPGNRHGPGGGGGGGYILTSSAPASTNVSGGSNGVTTSANDAFGAQPGTSGVVQLITGNNVLPGGDGASCSAADLAITNTDNPDPVQAAQNVTYTPVVTNNGPNSADGVTATFPIPASSTFVSISAPPAGWTCITPAAGGTGTISCTVPTMASLATANFSFIVNVNNGTPAGYTLSETNSVTSNTPDSNTSNNQATATTLVEAETAGTYADMAVTISQSTNYPTAGSNITYTQTVTNNGPTAAANPTYSFTTPANTTFQSMGAPPAGWTCITPPMNGTGTITCSGSSALASGASVSMGALVLKVNAGTAAGTTITATPSVGTTTTDPYSANNTASVTSTVVAAGSGDVAITLSNSPGPVSPSESYTYTAVATNNGPNTAANITVTIPVPAGTGFQSLTPPVGWSCSTPAVGASGNITCTIASLASGASATFSPVVQVSPGTASGTSLSSTATIATTTTDSIASNNSATATNLVTSSTNADVAIVKTDSPDPVGQGQLITYRMSVTNNGPATATNVSVSDTLVASLTFVSSSASQGSCAGTSTINCSLGTMPVGTSAIVTVVVQATATGTISNTATVTRTETDPVSSNDSSTTTTSVLAVTLVHLRTFVANQQKERVQITWQTSFEADNLGFNVYRDVGGTRTKINKGVIAGSALGSKRDDTTAGHAYRLNDRLPSAQTFAQYWLEDIDTHGVRTMHGPVSTAFGVVPDTPSNTTPLGGLGQQGSVLESQPGMGVLHDLSPATPDDKSLAAQQDLAANTGLKIFVAKEGWQHVTYTAMSAAGFDGSDTKHLSLYVNAVEIPLILERDGVSFYGLPLDTASTGARTYWLRAKGNANRIATSRIGGSTLTGDVPFTYARTERTVYFPGLTNNGDHENMFGPILTTDPYTQSFTLAGVDTASTGNATLDIVVQGGSEIPHSLNLDINGHSLTTAIWLGQTQQTFSYPIPQTWIVNGTNALTLTARFGDDDVSVLVTTRVTYQHVLRDDSGALEVSLPGGRTVTVGGFPSSTVNAFDVTDPQNPVALTVTTATDPQGGFAATFTTPNGATARTILAADASRNVTDDELAVNKPSTWSDKNAKGGNFVVISNSAFAAAATSLAGFRAQQGLTTALVDIDDVYDEYNFGVRSPNAIRSFLLDASKNWKYPPKWVVLLGDASLDPRNYFGAGASDYLPTKIVITTGLKTASDGWFTDFNNDGIEDIPIGRIPVQTAADASMIVSRITSRGTPTGAWANSVLFVADTPNTYDFPGAAASIAALLPPGLSSQTIRYDRSADPHGDTVNAMNNGQLLVDYVGHGSVELWSEGVFQSSDAVALTNGSKLPVAILMTCLNGYFHDSFSQSVAEALLLAPTGGAVGVWASTTLTEPDQQAVMNRELFRQVFGNPTLTLGEAILRAKAAVNDSDVKKSWLFFGDPSMKLRQ